MIVVALFVMAGGVVSAFRPDDQPPGAALEFVTGVLVPEPSGESELPSACIEEAQSHHLYCAGLWLPERMSIPPLGSHVRAGVAPIPGSVLGEGDTSQHMYFMHFIYIAQIDPDD
jgi:hypothetical protein